MKEVRLTPEQKIDLEALYDTNRDKWVYVRVKAVLLRSEGWTTAMIVQALRLYETTIVRHIDDYVHKKITTCQWWLPILFDWRANK